MWHKFVTLLQSVVREVRPGSPGNREHHQAGSRALWIVPLSFVTALTLKSKACIQWPWFILLFCLAALLNTWLPAIGAAFLVLNHVGKVGLTVTLFLIGTGLNRHTLKRVGVRGGTTELLLTILYSCSPLS